MASAAGNWPLGATEHRFPRQNDVVSRHNGCGGAALRGLDSLEGSLRGISECLGVLGPLRASSGYFGATRSIRVSLGAFTAVIAPIGHIVITASAVIAPNNHALATSNNNINIYMSIITMITNVTMMATASSLTQSSA
eukprot:4614093-Pyramimonas_sp.AAC.1